MLESDDILMLQLEWPVPMSEWENPRKIVVLGAGDSLKLYA